MNLKQALNREKKHEDVDVNIIPVMNIFLLLIPFLLLTAAFVKIAVLELSLPSLGKGDETKQQIEQKKKDLVLVILAIKEDGFQLKSPSFKFAPLKKMSGNYNYGELTAQLKQIKIKHRYAEDIIISPEGRVKYNIIIKAMDHCRESGFPNVSLAG